VRFFFTVYRLFHFYFMHNSKEAFVTLVTSEDYIQGALVVARSLRHAGTTKHISCLITPTISSHSQYALKAMFDSVIQVDLIASNSLSNLDLLGRPDLLYTLTKLHVWRLEQFDKVVFLDAVRSFTFHF
jgi:glycogenin glucosyltransferase